MAAGLLVVGGYRIGRRLDQGRVNPVYEATDASGRGPVVVRLLRAARRLDAAAAQACRAEIAVVARLRHPHIASMLTLDTTPEGVPFVARELVQGEPLERYLARRGRLPVTEVARLVTPMALTLAAVHQRGVIHGELRPSKLYVQGEGEQVVFSKLVSFGLWRLHSDRQGPGALAHPTRYSSPELIEGRPGIDGRSDQFALAAIAYRMLAGVDAFPGDDVAAVLRGVLQLAPPSLAAMGVASEDVDAVLRRALAKRPEDRFDSAPAFAAALESAAAGEPVEITRPVGMGQIEASALLLTPPARPAPPMPAMPAPSSRPPLDRSLDRVPWDHRGPLALLAVIVGLGAALAWWLDWQPAELTAWLTALRG